LCEQRAGFVDSRVVVDPDLRQRLVGWDFAGDAAGEGALHAGVETGLPEHVAPQ